MVHCIVTVCGIRAGEASLDVQGICRIIKELFLQDTIDGYTPLCGNLFCRYHPIGLHVQHHALGECQFKQPIKVTFQKADCPQFPDINVPSLFF
jgi:hypothetical protein